MIFSPIRVAIFQTKEGKRRKETEEGKRRKETEEGKMEEGNGGKSLTLFK